MLGATSCLFVLLLVISGAKSLRDVKISFPSPVKMFSTVTMRCEYDLEDDVLYSVKWYKGENEFFRYQPGSRHPTTSLGLTRVYINDTRSDSNEIVLDKVWSSNTGDYSCEVSTVGPYSLTKASHAYLFVGRAPAGHTLLEVREENVGANHTLKAKCTTPSSYPKLNVSWYINDQEVDEIKPKRFFWEYARRFSPEVPTVSHIEKEIDDIIYQGEVIKIQCVATFFNFYRGEDTRYINDSRPHPKSSSGTEISMDMSRATRVPIWMAFLILLVWW